MTDDRSRDRPLTIRPKAVEDIERQADYLDEHATPAVARRFRIAVMDAVETIREMPEAGSPREVRNPSLTGLRMWPVRKFRKYLLFYITPNESIEIVRLIHGARDLDAILEAEE
jgi:toxin ParE1/3/4